MKRSLGPSSGQSALAKPGDCGDITARLDAGDPVTSHLLAAPALAGTPRPSPCFGLHLAAGPVLAAVEDAYFTAAALFTEANASPAAAPPSTPSRAASAASHENPRGGRSPDTPALIGKRGRRSRLP